MTMVLCARSGLELDGMFQMSFFFDVVSTEGFILASDVRLMEGGENKYLHKIRPCGHNCRVKCAIAVCGDYPESSLNFFTVAQSRGDSLKGIASDFAQQWTRRFCGGNQYSAVHLVGYEKLPGSRSVPQLWYWFTSDGEHFASEDKLKKDLESFSQPIPVNNHLPRLIQRQTGKTPNYQDLETEMLLTNSYLKLYEPVFTWNGDTAFWNTALNAVGSAMNLLGRQQLDMNIERIGSLTRTCLEFLIKLGELLPNPTVAASPGGMFDILRITPDELKWLEHSNLDVI